jgi:hypothetical protein
LVRELRSAGRPPTDPTRPARSASVSVRRRLGDRDACCSRSRTTSDLEIRRVRDSSSMSATSVSGRRTVSIFMGSSLYYDTVRRAIRMTVEPPRGMSTPAQGQVRFDVAQVLTGGPCRPTCGHARRGSRHGLQARIRVRHQRPASLAASCPIADQSSASPPRASSMTKRSWRRLASGIGTRRPSAAASPSRMSFAPSGAAKPAGSNFCSTICPP